ncbi:uncharacterized protein B0T23DRAFT_393954 [Neurospora hispaniola]|uniref:Uncharacterized protein n=1 Tax=Neurospora hispaniola TaxID=588809 RepID=A0AAJ0MU74_9PEZI|nr:hypothetical protein B0T23DRAFT_393954 [Neurospora hispaniola]
MGFRKCFLRGTAQTILNRILAKGKGRVRTGIRILILGNYSKRKAAADINLKKKKKKITSEIIVKGIRFFTEVIKDPTLLYIFNGESGMLSRYFSYLCWLVIVSFYYIY